MTESGTGTVGLSLLLLAAALSFSRGVQANPIDEPMPGPPANPFAVVPEPEPPPVATPSPEPDEAPEVEPVPEPEVAFGEPGQWVIVAGSTNGAVSSSSFSNSDAHFFSVGGELGVDRFVLRHFSLGIDVAASHGDRKGYNATSLTETKSTSFSGGVRLGFDVPFGRLFSWYPRLTLGLSTLHSDTHTIDVFVPRGGAPPSSASRIGPWFNLYAPILVHPVPHFFVGLGPRIEHDFGNMRGGPYDGSQTTIVGLDLTVGGFWGGPRAAEPAPPPKATPIRMGRKGQTVLTSATNASLESFSYSHTDASNLSVSINPGFDYFVVDDVSFGIDSGVGHSSATSFDSNGVKSISTSSFFGLAPRLGFHAFIVEDVLSVWLQAELGFGRANESVSAPGSNNAHQRGRTWVAASLPFLVHPTSHWFLGAGPSVSHELSDVDQNEYENDATSVGANFVLGGWL